MVAPIGREQLDILLPHVYDELRLCASRALAGERIDHTLQTTALVHEAYVRLARLREIDWKSENDVLRAAVGIMRRVLIDFARAKNAKKRDGKNLSVIPPSDDFQDATMPEMTFDLLALDEALTKLRQFDERKAEIVELRYFGGQCIESVASLLGISNATVKRDWAITKAWMHRELNGAD